MELLDVLNKQGEKTGEQKDKVKIHEVGDWHRVVHIWIINPRGELLIQHRSPQMDSYPNSWDISSAGHIRAGELSLDAAQRELKEELNLEFLPDSLEFLFTVVQQVVLNDGKYFNNEFCDVYLLVKDLDPARIKLQPEELDGAKFMPYHELEEIIGRGGENFVPHPEEYEKLFEILHQRFYPVE